MKFRLFLIVARYLHDIVSLKQDLWTFPAVIHSTRIPSSLIWIYMTIWKVASWQWNILLSLLWKVAKSTCCSSQSNTILYEKVCNAFNQNFFSLACLDAVNILCKKDDICHSAEGRMLCPRTCDACGKKIWKFVNINSLFKS